MDKAKLIELLQDGAVFLKREDKFYHPSFQKGWRKLRTSDIAWQAVERVLGTFGTDQLHTDTDGFTLIKTN